MNNEQATLNLIAAKQILDNLGIHSWLTCGTLLGYCRENDFIKHDNDIDISVFIKDYKPEIVEAFEQKGFSLLHTFGTIEQGLEYTFSKEKIRLDIFFFYEETDYYWCGGWMQPVSYLDQIIHQNKQHKILKYRYPKPLIFKSINFKGYQFNIPEDPINYITCEYGTYWYIPNASWHWSMSSKNLIDAPWMRLTETEIKRNYHLMSQLYIQVLYSLVEEYKQNPSNKSVLLALQAARKEQVDFWLLLPPEQVKDTYTGLMGIAHKILLDSGINHQSIPEQEEKVVNEIQAKLAEESQQENATKYLLANSLYPSSEELVLQKDTSVHVWNARYVNMTQTQIVTLLESQNFWHFSASLWKVWWWRFLNMVVIPSGRKILSDSLRRQLWKIVGNQIYPRFKK